MACSQCSRLYITEVVIINTTVCGETGFLTELSHNSVRPYSICRIWIQIHSESTFGFTGKSNGLDSWVLSEVTSLLFIYVYDTDVTSGFASESTSNWIR